MPRRQKSSKPSKSRLTRAKSAVSRTTKKVTARLRPAKTREKPRAATPRVTKKGDGKPARRTRRQTDIPLDVLSRTYTPTQTSLKAPFRTTGADRERDQELAGGYSDERWNDEDHFTNKSGDPRIGTHHRKYEPNE